MGTNFYTYLEADCDNPAHGERIHIGKSSGGWKFGFQTYVDPERSLDLTSWAAWREFLSRTGRIALLARRPRYPITDQYGKVWPLEDFELLVLAKQKDITRTTGPYAGTEPAWCHVTPVSDHQREANSPRSTWLDPPTAFHDAEGFDFDTRTFS